MRLSDERLLRVRILSHTGDKIHIKLPVGFVKKIITFEASGFMVYWSLPCNRSYVERKMY